MIPTIRFSHRYIKMPEDMDGTILLTGASVDIADIPKEFIEYDTAYVTPAGNTAYYRLPEAGRVIVLFLFSPKGQGRVWTTIRSHTPEKEKYYQSIISKAIRIEIKE